jgi:hypothetical protein
MNRIVLCLLLLSMSARSQARDVRLHGANGDGGAGAEGAVAPAAPPAPAKPTPGPASHAKAKAPPLFRGGGDDDAGPHAPRWHSFLPGMFR